MHCGAECRVILFLSARHDRGIARLDQDTTTSECELGTATGRYCDLNLELRVAERG